MNYTIVPFCETITATTAGLKVSKPVAQNPAKFINEKTALCFVRNHIMSFTPSTKFDGESYEVDIETGEIKGITAARGEKYDVFYFAIMKDTTTFIYSPDGEMGIQKNELYRVLDEENKA